jgi:hypothetical protein
MGLIRPQAGILTYEQDVLREPPFSLIEELDGPGATGETTEHNTISSI